ncbi:hypothetical protein CRYUN_Cryun11dG0153900 [Craigia yunnanensis]
MQGSMLLHIVGPYQFSSGWERSGFPVEFSWEICRTLKPGGFLVVHVTAKDTYCLQSFLDLFNCSRLIRSRKTDGPNSSTTIQEIVIKKERQNSPLNGNSVVDISFKRKYVYVDVGASSYGSSIGSWFKKQYSKQNKSFEIYAIEANKAFNEEYTMKKRVELLPYVAWIRNETLFFEITRDPRKKNAVVKGR